MIIRQLQQPELASSNNHKVVIMLKHSFVIRLLAMVDVMKTIATRNLIVSRRHYGLAGTAYCNGQSCSHYYPHY